jgi:DNA polymerase I
MSDRALIIDGNNYFNIAYWSAQKRNNQDYIPIRFFQRISEAYEVYKKEFTFLFVVWDSRNNNRKSEDATYKATRKEKPANFYDMMPYIVDILTMREVQQYQVDGYEGDDVIYSIVEMCKEKGYSVTISSADHDMYQMLDDNIDIYDPFINSIVDKNKFIKEYTVKPEQWKFIKSLMTDISDNIVGVKGIGEKSAIKIIKEYGDLDNFYNSDMSKVSKAIKNKMIAKEDGYDAKESAYHSLGLVQFRKIDLRYPENAAITPIKVNASLYMEAI